MMNCKEVENILPLYEDDLLTGAEKQALEQHLKSCSKCAKAYVQLQKTGRLVEGLAQVEPPPWFKQKIMSRIHEEAAKKSLVQKWFYPLRIKIPVQIMATIVVAVFAVYIYRSVNEQANVEMPPTLPTVMETKKNMVSAQTQGSETDKTVAKEKVNLPETEQSGKNVGDDLPAGNDVVNTRELKKSMPPDIENTLTTDVAKTIKSGAPPVKDDLQVTGSGGSFPKRDIPRLAESIQPPAGAGSIWQRGNAAVDKKESSFAPPPEKQSERAKVVSPSGVEVERKKEAYFGGASRKQSATQTEQSIIPKAAFSLRVADTDDAVGEVEKILTNYEAKKINKQKSNSTVYLTIEIKAHKMKDFVAQLKTIGRIEVKDIPLDKVEGDILVVIEIVSN